MSGLCCLGNTRSSLTPEPRKVGSEPVKQDLGCSGREYVFVFFLNRHEGASDVFNAKHGMLKSERF